MIFVTVGTTAFDSLIKSVDEISKEIEEEVICQIAGGKFIPNNCAYFRFKSSLREEIGDADLVICHGGAGTLFNLIALQKKVIAVPNVQRKDKHQMDLIEKLAGGNYIMCCHDLSDLKRKILASKDIRLSTYEKPECRIAEEIVHFIGE